jgi:hypothetical protein
VSTAKFETGGHKRQRTLSYNKGWPPQQATLYLRRGDSSMVAMDAAWRDHPLARGSNDIEPAEFALLKGKVNLVSPVECHESSYNIKFKTTLGFWVTFGFSRHKDGDQNTGVVHAWICFGAGCNEEWQRYVAMDFLLNITGHHSMFESSSPKHTTWVLKANQPQAAASSGLAPPPLNQPMAVSSGSAAASPGRASQPPPPLNQPMAVSSGSAVASSKQHPPSPPSQLPAAIFAGTAKVDVSPQSQSANRSWHDLSAVLPPQQPPQQEPHQQEPFQPSYEPVLHQLMAQGSPPPFAAPYHQSGGSDIYQVQRSHHEPSPQSFEPVLPQSMVHAPLAVPYPQSGDLGMYPLQPQNQMQWCQPMAAGSLGLPYMQGYQTSPVVTWQPFFVPAQVSYSPDPSVSVGGSMWETTGDETDAVNEAAAIEIENYDVPDAAMAEVLGRYIAARKRLQELGRQVKSLPCSDAECGTQG